MNACNEFVAHTNLTQIDRCGRCGKHKSIHANVPATSHHNGVHKPADLSKPQTVASADTLAKDAQIVAATNAALPGIGVAIDQLRTLMVMPGNLVADAGVIPNTADRTLITSMPMREEGIAFALLVQACGMAKANGWPLGMLATALGQAWKQTEVTASDTVAPASKVVP